MSSSDPQLATKLRHIYDEYRTALMRSKYYAHRLETYKKWDKTLEIALAVSTSSTVGTWALWRIGYGKQAWAIIAGISALLAIVKPILQLQNKIEQFSQLHISHDSVYQDLKQLVKEIAISHTITSEISKVFSVIQARYGALALAEEAVPAKKLLQKYYDEVNKEIPPQTLWMPS